jgi:hypothetical protein
MIYSTRSVTLVLNLTHVYGGIEVTFAVLFYLVDTTYYLEATSYYLMAVTYYLVAMTYYLGPKDIISWLRVLSCGNDLLY